MRSLFACGQQPAVYVYCPAAMPSESRAHNFNRVECTNRIVPNIYRYPQSVRTHAHISNRQTPHKI